jgi:cell division protein FtsL
MLTFIIIAVIIAVAVFVAMKTGKVADANNNNIPDAIEEKIAEVKEVVDEAKAKIAKAPKAPKAKTTAKKTTKK